MPSNIKPPVSDLSSLLKKLRNARVEFILVGGLAAVAQGAPITTFDLDIVHRRTDKNIKRLFKFLQSVNAYQRRPDDKVISIDAMDFHGQGHQLLITDLGPLDVLSTIEKKMGYDELLPLAAEIELGGKQIRVLGLESIISLKNDTTDPQERYRLQIYKDTLRLKSEE